MERNPAGLGHVYINTVDGSIAVLPLSTRKFDDWPLFSFFFPLHEAFPNTLLKVQSIKRTELRTTVVVRKHSKTRGEFLIIRVACRQQGDINRYCRSIPSCL